MIEFLEPPDEGGEPLIAEQIMAYESGARWYGQWGLVAAGVVEGLRATELAASESPIVQTVAGQGTVVFGAAVAVLGMRAFGYTRKAQDLRDDLQQGP